MHTFGHNMYFSDTKNHIFLFPKSLFLRVQILQSLVNEENQSHFFRLHIYAKYVYLTQFNQISQFFLNCISLNLNCIFQILQSLFMKKINSRLLNCAQWATNHSGSFQKVLSCVPPKFSPLQVFLELEQHL